MTRLETKLFKIKDTFPDVDVSHLMSVMNKYEQGVFISPEPNDFNVFYELYEYNLVSKQVTPIFVNGEYRGVSIRFLYKKDLNF